MVIKNDLIAIGLMIWKYTMIFSNCCHELIRIVNGTYSEIY